MIEIRASETSATERTCTVMSSVTLKFMKLRVHNGFNLNKHLHDSLSFNNSCLEVLSKWLEIKYNESALLGLGVCIFQDEILTYGVIYIKQFGYLFSFLANRKENRKPVQYTVVAKSDVQIYLVRQINYTCPMSYGRSIKKIYKTNNLFVIINLLFCIINIYQHKRDLPSLFPTFLLSHHRTTHLLVAQVFD